MIQPVILCGGSGTRLWPLSTPQRPKPFLKLIGDRTLFQQTLDRLAYPDLFSSPIIVAGEAHVAPIQEQAGDIKLIVEPAARNTAPAIALAAARLDPETVMLVCPSDHFISDNETFRNAVSNAAELAREGCLVSLGVEPDRPETGYGYIEVGEPLGSGNRVACFVEKPDQRTAETFLSSGEFVWNAGIFVFTAGSFMNELSEQAPKMASLVRRAVSQGHTHGSVFYPDVEPFTEITGISIDYALMEKTSRAAVVSADMGWSDIGSWAALLDYFERVDGTLPSGETTRLVDCERVLVRSDGPRVSVAGLSDVIVVVEGDEVLVLSKEAAQSVSSLSKP